jgi:hypothetical protein
MKHRLESYMSSKKVVRPRKSGGNAMEDPRGGESHSPRILARQLARPLSNDEIDFVAGGARVATGGTCSAGTCCTPDCDD